MTIKPDTKSPEKISNTAKIPTLLGVVLCGGKATRMGGKDKGLVTFSGKPMASYAIDALGDCEQVIINANRNQNTYQSTFHLPVVSDADKQFSGPLSGMLAALQYAKAQGLTWVISVPCDAPYITREYVKTLYHVAQSRSEKIFMADDGFRQPVFALLHVDIIESLQAFLQGEQKKILLFYQQVGFYAVKFEQSRWFTNINSDVDKQQAEQESNAH